MSAHLLIPGDHEPVGRMCRLDQMSVLRKGTRNSRRSSSPGERLALNTTRWHSWMAESVARQTSGQASAIGPTAQPISQRMRQ